jgi:hypothetical protein
MKNLVLLASLATAAWTLAFGTSRANAAQQEEATQATSRRAFRLHRVEPGVAETWVWELCDSSSSAGTCRVVEVIEGEQPRLIVDGTDRVHAEVSRMLARRDAAVRPARSFQLVLLQATKGKGEIDPSLGKGALEALQDVADYLPFTSFRLLDTAFLATTRDGETRVAGPDGLQYIVELSYRDAFAVDGPMIDVMRFRVRGEVVRELGPLIPTAAESEADSAPRGPRTKSVETLLDTSLSMRPGETVVVGTSRLDGGDEALVVLLTAIDG